VTVNVSSTDTASLTYGEDVYVYQLRAALATSGRKVTLATGNVTVVRDLTVAA
jgi:hypothetical protein